MGYLQGWLLSMGIGGLETPVAPEAAENTRCEVVGFVCRAEHLGCLVAGGRRNKILLPEVSLFKRGEGWLMLVMGRER